MSTSAPAQLHALRRTPTQARSRATFELLLATTATLLDERGYGGLTTNLVSERSGISIQALYRYFPNKESLVVELARQMNGRWFAALEHGPGLADPATDWRLAWPGYLQRYLAAVRSTPGARAVLSATRAEPGLRAVDDEANAAYIEAVAVALSARTTTISPADATQLATVLIASTVGVIDAALDTTDREADRLIHHLTTMHLALLEHHLDRATSPIPEPDPHLHPGATAHART